MRSAAVASASTMSSAMPWPAPGILGCQDVVAQAAQDLDDRVAEVFVGVETGQGSGDLVLVNRRQDLVAVGFGVGPSIDEVLSSQGRVVEQELSFGHTEVTCLDELPDWDPGAGDPSRSAADTHGLVDPRSLARRAGQFCRRSLDGGEAAGRVLCLKRMNISLRYSDDLGNE